MLTSIKKFTKSFLTKTLLIIIILPFVFWGMGDVFSTGNQNIIVTIESKKISTQEFTNYLQRLNLNEEQRKNLRKTDMLDKILSDYIGKKVISLEVEDLGVKITDKSLKNIIISDKTFYRNNKFSRTAYEKFLLESGMTAPTFERSIIEQEKKRQLLTYLSEGTILPVFLIENAFRKENQIKTIKYIDLHNLFKNKKIEGKEIIKVYNENKRFFSQKFKTITYTQLTPSKLTGENEYSESFFKIINKIENDILDGEKISDLAKTYNLSLKTTEEIDLNKKNINGKKIENISDKFFQGIYKKKINSPELIIIEDKYFVGEVNTEKEINRKIEDVEVRESIVAQIKIKNIVETNNNISKKISEGKFNEAEMNAYAKKNNLEIKTKIIRGIKDDKVFSEEILKRILKLKNNDLNIITNSMLNKNFIVFIEKSEEQPFNNNSKDYKKYKAIAKLDLANKIYSTFDLGMNKKYKIEVNQKVLNRIKNTL